MFIHFSWSAYLLYTGIAVLLYLLVIAWTCYRKDILCFLQSKRKEKKTGIAPAVHKPGDALPIVYELVNDLTVAIKNAAEAHSIHAEIFFSLQHIIKNYLILSGTEFPAKINQFIREELLRYGIPSLSDEEYSALWKEDMSPVGKANLLIVLMLCFSVSVTAQDGIAGIREADTKVRSYFTVGTQLMYAVGAIVGLIGAVKVFQKWNAGDHDTGKVAAAWFGSCVFLVVVVTVIKAFFGI